jgi:hypothetical protein
MTAEIAIMNRQGVALAADSAVTLTGTSGPKIFASADKIFALSKYEPVATMVYGTASLMQVPWETIVKVYREQFGDTAFPHLDDYARDFMGFLARDGNLLFEDEQKHQFAFNQAFGLFDHLADVMVRAVQEATDEAGGALTLAQSRRVALRVITDHHAQWSRQPDRAGITRGIKTRLLREYAPDFERAKQAVFEDFRLPATASRRLTELALLFNVKFRVRGDAGIVFAGYGRKEIFPQLVSFELDGVLLNTVVGHERSRLAISPTEGAIVHGFAQSDMIALFMEGVTQEYEQFVESYVETVIADYGQTIVNALPSEARSANVSRALAGFQEGLIGRMREDFGTRRNTDYVTPVLDVVSSLPKDELGSMASSLVNLTSLKRRVSMENETVGGPVDVAVVTKGDGLIWTQRKHYFDSALNQHFFANYYRRKESA